MVHMRMYMWSVFVMSEAVSVYYVREHTRTQLVTSASLIQSRSSRTRLELPEAVREDKNPQVRLIGSRLSVNASVARQELLGRAPELVSNTTEHSDYILAANGTLMVASMPSPGDISPSAVGSTSEGDCKKQCRGRNGYCEYCGLGRACCSKNSHKKSTNFHDYAEECSRAEFPDNAAADNVCVDVAHPVHVDGVPWLKHLNFHLGTAPIFVGNQFMDYNMSMTMACGNNSVSRLAMKHEKDIFTVTTKDLSFDCLTNTSLSVSLFGKTLYDSTVQSELSVRDTSFDMEFSLPPAHTLTPRIRSKSCEEAGNFMDLNIDFLDPHKESSFGSIIGFLMSTYPQNFKRSIETTLQTLLCQGLDFLLSQCLDPFFAALANRFHPVADLLQRPQSSKPPRLPELLSLNATSHYNELSESSHTTYDEDCWEPCGQQEGWCLICPASYACCRQGRATAEECQGVSSDHFTRPDRHECVPSPAAEPWMRSVTFGEPMIEIPDFTFLGDTYDVYDFRCGGASFQFSNIEFVDSGVNVHFFGFGLECAAQMVVRHWYLITKDLGGIHIDLNLDQPNVIGFFFELKLADDGSLEAVTMPDCAYDVWWRFRRFGHWTSPMINAFSYMGENIFQPLLEGIWCKHISPAILSIAKPMLQQMYSRFHVCPSCHPIQLPPIPKDICIRAVESVNGTAQSSL